MNETMNIEAMANWSEPRQQQTKRGLRQLRTGTPNGQFWAAWRADKEGLKAQGISCLSTGPDGSYEARWWKPLGASYGTPAPAMALPQRETAPAGTVAPAPAPVAAQPAVHVPGKVTWSNEQEEIFTWFRSGSGNLVIEAFAGTGKTTTIKEAFNHAPEKEMLYCVFNKKNEREAKAKISNPRVDIKTLHSLGFSYILKVWAGMKPDDRVEDDRLRAIEADIHEEVAGSIKKLVGYAKNTTVAMPTMQQLAAMAMERDIFVPGYEEMESGGWTVGKVAEVAFKMLQAALTRDAAGRISFNDMVWLPVVKGWVRPEYDLVVVDECQDMSLPQLIMAMGACRPGGRVVVVGDQRQCIYSFRGAVSDGMDMMRRKLNAKTLTLSTTYRCPKLVVELAQAIVPGYKAAPTAPLGELADTTEKTVCDMLQVGDALLSRINAPLMGICLSLLRKGVPARIEGKDIGKELANIVKKLKARSVPHFLAKIETYREKMRKRIGEAKNAQERIDQLNDKVDTLVAVAEGASSVAEIEQRLVDLFQDSDETSKPAVVLSSVHRSKGLEWPNVYLLMETFNRKSKKGKPQSEDEAVQEKNLMYVAQTRTMKKLVRVFKGDKAASTSQTPESKN